MQIEKSIVVSQDELLAILTEAAPAGLTVTALEFFYSDGQKVRLIVADKPQTQTEAPKMSYRKTYLGDSVYCELNECRQFRLTTENGFGPTNEILLEPEVLEALIKFSEAMQNEATGVLGGLQ
jgi:hypothetical protein